MHEVAAIKGVITTICAEMREAGGTKITGVHLVLGASGHMTEEGARQNFAMLATGTPAADAVLDIEWRPATYRCLDCLRDFAVIQVEEPVICPQCGGIALEIEHQDVCYASEIVFEGEQASVEG